MVLHVHKHHTHTHAHRHTLSLSLSLPVPNEDHITSEKAMLSKQFYLTLHEQLWKYLESFTKEGTCVCKIKIHSWDPSSSASHVHVPAGLLHEDPRESQSKLLMIQGLQGDLGASSIPRRYARNN